MAGVSRNNVKAYEQVLWQGLWKALGWVCLFPWFVLSYYIIGIAFFFLAIFIFDISPGIENYSFLYAPYLFIAVATASAVSLFMCTVFAQRWRKTISFIVFAVILFVPFILFVNTVTTRVEIVFAWAGHVVGGCIGLYYCDKKLHAGKVQVFKKQSAQKRRKHWAVTLVVALVAASFVLGVVPAIGDVKSLDLFLAAHNGNTDEVERLLSEGAGVDYEVYKEDTFPFMFNISSVCHFYGGPRTSLVEAVMLGHFEVVELLIARGADVDNKYWGKTSLMWAEKNGHTDVAKLLRKHGAK